MAAEKELGQNVLDLIKKKETIEKDIAAEKILLEAHNVWMEEPLTDENDFPRSDIPVIEIRAARAKIIHLMNDLKAINKEIEDALTQFHAQDLPQFKDKSGRSPELSGRYKKLAKFMFIEEGSPAERAGLKNEDIILEFGPINGDNYTSLTRDFGNVVINSLDMYIKVIVERQGALMRVNLKPISNRPSGPLGCRIVNV